MRSSPPPIPPLAKKIVVEPLDPERLTRIERTVVTRTLDASPARAPRSSWFGLAAVVGATALAAGVIGWLAHGRGGPVTADLPPVALAAPLRVHTDAAASTLDIGDATITSSPATAFVITRPDGGVLVDMAHGRVELEVGKRGDRAPLVVRAGDTDVVVVGTHFIVDYGDQASRVVTVLEGRVHVVRPHDDVFVAAGQTWSESAGVMTAELGPGAGRADLGRAGSDGSGAVIGEIPGRGGDAMRIAIGPTPRVLHDRVAAIPDPTRPVVVVHHDDGSAAHADTVILANGDHASPGAKLMLDAQKDPHTAVLAAIREVALRAPLDVGTTDANAQAVQYTAIAFPKAGDENAKFGADASSALYSLAFVQAMKQGRTGDALTSIDAYLRRFGHGADLGQVLWLKLRIHCLDRRWDTECKPSAQQYLAKAPNGAGAHVAELITYQE